ncbi:nuclear transport factor 2 family protein [Kutzneria sp. NPDC052558]|uniref:nuclear transport factor 2 family protein n=1 Tax=Kutzneria sp. NPDC052558 TaxID=3364121 RepID=UPI0037C7B6CD
MNPPTRAVLAGFWASWLDANREAERTRNWAPLADFYAEDATYGWMYSPDEHFMAVGREEIRRHALVAEMAGMEGWHYDYMATVIDEATSMIVGFWKQRSGVPDDAGGEYEVLGIGGSWFGVGLDAAGGLSISWQRDWFDFGSTAHTFMEIAGSGRAPRGLLDRMALDGRKQPGHYRRKDLPSTVWPPPVEEGRYVIREDQ